MMTMLSTFRCRSSRPPMGDRSSPPENSSSSRFVTCPMAAMVTLLSSASASALRYTRSALSTGRTSEVLPASKFWMRCSTYMPLPAVHASRVQARQRCLTHASDDASAQRRGVSRSCDAAGVTT
eukprot:1911276-Prymnesium_polylepis.3